MKQTNVCEHVDCVVVYEAGKSCPLCRELGRELDAVNALLSEVSFEEGLKTEVSG